MYHLPVICCVYVSADSYLSIHTHPSLEAHELLRIVGLKMDRTEEDMVLAVASHTGGTHTQTDRQADRQTDRQADRQADRR